MHESARSSACGLRRLLCLCALGSCSSGFLFGQRVWCAFNLSVVRQLLRLSWLRVLQLLPELLWLWLGRLLSAFVAGSGIRGGLWVGRQGGVGGGGGAEGATIAVGGGIGTTAGIMAGGKGRGGAADTAGMAADGTAVIDSES